MSTILLVSPEPWEGHSVSKHHYARELSQRGHNVLFYGPPEKSGPIKLDLVSKAIDAEHQGQVWVLRSPRVAPGLRFMPNVLRRMLEARWLRQVEHNIGMPINVVWNFENSRFFDMRFAGERLKIYQQVDLNQDLHPAQAATTADIAIALNPTIRARLLSLGANKTIHLVSHGLSVPHAPKDIPKLPDNPSNSVHAAYIGNLGMKYLDIEAFSTIVRQHKERVVFHLFGKFDQNTPLRKTLRDEKNVIWYGWQDPQIVAHYLEAMDITMVLYRTEMDVEQISNSHKILEYLHSGAVIASSFLLDYKDRPDLIEMAALGGSYPDLFASVISRLKELNSPERRRARKSYSLNHTYSRKVDQIEKIIATQFSNTPLNSK